MPALRTYERVLAGTLVGRVPAGPPPTMVGVPASDPRDRPIAVFDSGVGGLTVLHELLVALPQEDYVYLGDSARFPYGERTQQELEAFGMDIADELIARRAKLLVVACNSMTAAALPALQRRMLETTLGIDVIGVVRPEAAQAVAVTRTGRIGLLATPRDRRLRRLRARRRGRRPARRPGGGRLPGPRAADPGPAGRRAVHARAGGRRARLLRAAGRGRASTPSSSAARTTRWCARCSSGCSAAA